MKNEKFDFQKCFQNVEASIGQIYVHNEHRIISYGTGFVYKFKGWFVTLFSIIDVPDISKISLSFDCDDEDFDASIIYKDSESGIAILGFDNENIKPLMMKENGISQCQEVIVIGYPFQRQELFANRGMISRLGENNNYQQRMWIDGHINGGNEGSPVLDDNGHVIGIIEGKELECQNALRLMDELEFGGISIGDLDLAAALWAIGKNLHSGLTTAIPADCIPTRLP